MVNSKPNRIPRGQGRTGEIIREKRKQLGLTLESLSETLGATNPYLSMLETGKRIASDMLLLRISNKLELDYEQLRQIAEKERYERAAKRMKAKYFEIQKAVQEKGMVISDDMIFIPVIGLVPGRYPLSTESEKAICVPEDLIKDKENIFALTIQGDSMTGRLEESDLVAFQRGLMPQNHAVAVVRIQKQIALKIVEFASGLVLLRSLNGDSETIYRDPKAKDDFEIIGKVVLSITQNL